MTHEWHLLSTATQASINWFTFSLTSYCASDD